MLISAGSQIDRFEVQRLLGEGGLARVYLVKHRRLSSLHAMKLLRVDGERLSRRFIQEGQVQAKIRHPNVVSVTDVVELEDEVGLVMEYVEGTTLAEVLVDGQPLPRTEIGPLFAEMCAGVEAAHREGVLHRDLKPGNVLLSLKGARVQAKIADFGIAKVLSESGRTALTDANTMMGTPGYMAPEQLRDAATVDVRADIFSLGCILYEMCSGRAPYLKADRGATYAATLSGAHRKLQERDPTLPPALCAAVERAISADPNGRFDTVREFALVVAACIPDLVRKPAPPTAVEMSMRQPAIVGTTMVPDEDVTDPNITDSAVSLPPPEPTDAPVSVTPRSITPDAYWEEDLPAPVAPRRAQLANVARLEKPRRAPANLRNKQEIVDFRRNRRWGPMDTVGPVFGFAAIATIGALLANGAAAQAVDASKAVKREAVALTVPWSEAAADLSTLLPKAEDPDALLARAEAFRNSPSPGERIHQGESLVRALRTELVRQSKGQTDPASRQRGAELTIALDRVEASLDSFADGVAAARDKRATWSCQLAEKMEWIGPESHPDALVLDPMDPVLIKPEVVAAPTPRRRNR